MPDKPHTTDRTQTPAVRDLGRMAYADAFETQLAAVDGVVSGETGETILLVEHDPVITVSRRPGVADHLVAGSDRLAKLGIDVQPTNRGGDITYHGPGQLVVYPILHLGNRKLNVGRYLRLLEEAVIQCLARFDIDGTREAGMTGVWVPVRDDRSEKICAMGVRVKRQVSMHGLALNVSTDLLHFETIVPCGLVGKEVTSLEKLLGDNCPKMNDVKTAMVEALNEQLDANPT